MRKSFKRQTAASATFVFSSRRRAQDRGEVEDLVGGWMGVLWILIQEGGLAGQAVLALRGASMAEAVGLPRSGDGNGC